MDRDVLRRPLYFVAFLGLLLFYLTAHDYLLSPKEGADAGQCREVSMFPSFARIRSFDQSHTKFASKFSLYLYREQGKDPIPENENEGFRTLDGIPALFIPGNAGSYRQMRSIAAEISNLYYDDNIHVVSNPNARNFDFFGADFNEDFTAFHGRTMLDQAEYLNEAIRFILLLYQNTPNPPTSILILAHSMGGIVARILPALENYVPGSINTIVTLSSPHSAAPLTFDGDILKIYLAIDMFWYDAFNDDPNSLGLARLRLHNVSLVSITGGLLDSVLPADYTTLGFLVPPSNGFSVYATGIPDVWTPMDHLAIVWCRQFRRQILRMLLELTDVNSPHRTYPLEQRMAIMRRHLLSGFEGYSKQDRFPPSENETHLTLKFDSKQSSRGALPHFIWKSTESNFLVTSNPLLNASTVSIISDTKLSLLPLAANSIKILLCRKLGESSRTIDLTNLATKEIIELNCVDLAEKTNLIPRSARDVESIMDSSFDGHKSPFHALRLNPGDFQGYDELVIIDRRSMAKRKRGFIVVDLGLLKDTQHTLAKDMFTLITRGADISLLSSGPLAINLHISGAWSSILAYCLKIKGLQQLQVGLFEPFVRQWKEEPYETKWHINLNSRNDLLISMHGIAPYTPFNQKPETRGLNLELWKDPQLDMNESEIETIDVVLKVDWGNSLKLLVMRYRLATISQCLAVTILATMFQFALYFSSGTFPDYIFGLLRVTQRNVMIPILITLSLLTPFTKLRIVQTVLNVIDPVVLQDPNELNLSLHEDFTLNSFFLGLQELVLSGVSWIFFFMAVGLNFLLYHVIQFFGLVAVSAASVISGIVLNTAGGTQEKKLSSLRRKFITTALVVLAVLFYLPYQFAYMVSFVIQTITTIKTMAQNRPRSTRNYHISFLMMMLWVLPINVPVLIVFVHNLNIQWSTPFSSHHNFMAVAPIAALCEMHSFFPELMPLGGDKLRIGKKVYLKVTFAILGYTVFYCTMYGARHTYWLHHLFNLWCSWLLTGFIDQIYHPIAQKSN